eukprot:TRINITY_DN12009_c0_g1_i7.p1 TRINITY_DN12009_c0_g1~~TRINITY_DN12009_c0_g1_i7.p1  ORF type:complete len:1771 (-),score=448.79 TRINITY_DN12009_c0_g1_i7:212-5524(-)
MSFSRLSIGTAMLGAVKEARKTGLTISLPNQLTGFVPFNQVSDALEKGDNLPEMFREGAVVLCVIVGMDKTQGKRRLELSLKSSELNQHAALSGFVDGSLAYGTVKSKEDRGWLMELGAHRLQGFVPKNAVDDADEMKVGCPKLCSVVQASKGSKSLILSTQTEQILGAKMKTKAAFSNLLPGSAVTCRVSEEMGAAERRSYRVKILDDQFEATIDWQHAAAQDLEKGKDLRARVLCINYEDKQVSLTMDKHLMNLSCKPVPKQLKIGQLVQDAIVSCVDEGVGLSLELPYKQNKTYPAYAHISQASEGFVDSLSKEFALNSSHVCRILNFNRLEGVAVVTLKQSVIEQQILSYNDITPGMQVEIAVIQAQTHGLKVSLTDSISGFVPLMQISDKPATESNLLTKFAPGQTVQARVLTVDPVKRSVILTLKKIMVNSELTMLTSFEEARPGEAYHGYVSSAKDSGLFVSFYDNVFGLIPKNELESYLETNSVPKVGHSLKVWLKKSNGTRLQFVLSAISGSSQKDVSSKKGDGFEQIQVGEIGPAKVTQVMGAALVMSLVNGTTGILPLEHLSDHPSLASALFEAVTAGTDLGDVVVLEKDSSKRKLVLSRKQSLIGAMESGSLPSTVDELEPGELYAGFVRAVHKYGVFVGFMNKLSGLAHKRALADVFVTDPEEHYKPGQSVNARLVELQDQNKMSLSLKPSDCPPHPDFAAVGSYFEDRELVTKLAIQASGANLDQQVWDQLAIGTLIDAQVMSVHDYGTVMSLLGDVVGFVKAEQHGETECEPGETVQCRVVDLSQDKGIVDLSIKLAAVDQNSKKRKRASVDLVEGARVSAVVELVKEDYLVLSVPNQPGVVGFALTHTFNNRQGAAHELYSLGQKINVTVAGASADGRLLMQITSNKGEPGKNQKGIKHAPVDPAVQGVSDIKIGMLTKAQVVKTTAGGVDVIMGRGIRGRIHSSQCTQAEPMNELQEGAVVSVRVLSKYFGKGGRIYELSSLDEVLAAKELPTFSSIDSAKEGKKIVGYVEEVGADGLSVWISPLLHGKMHAVETTTDFEVASALGSHFVVGQKVTCYIVKVDGHRNHVDLSLLAPKLRVARDEALRLGMVTQTNKKSGVFVRITGGVTGRAFLTDLTDTYAKDPVKPFKSGQIVRCRVLSVLNNGGNTTVDVTLRESQLAKKRAPAPDESCPVLGSVNQVEQGAVIQGYVRDISSKGCFVALASNITARVKLSDLADGFVDEIAQEFPVGKLVKGRVQTVDSVSGRIDMSLKQSVVDPSHESITFQDLSPGMLLRGSVKKVQDFGVFVNIDESNLSGLCHMSEVSEKFVKDIYKAYNVGDKVKVAVIRVNPANKHISLSMKAEHFEDGESEQEASSDEEEMDLVDSEEDEEDDNLDEIHSEEENAFEEEDEDEEEEDADEEDDEEGQDDEEDQGLQGLGGDKLQWDDAGKQQQQAQESEDEEEEESDDDDELPDSKTQRRKKKQRREQEHEAAVQAKEAKVLAGEQAPETVDDYERLVLEHPNSSFAWIKFIAFHVYLTDIEQARVVAQRALDTINGADSEERMQVWVAWMNLEHKYGDLSDTLQVTQNASNNLDAKEVYMKLLEIYDSDPSSKTADEVYKLVTKKFKQSAQIWTKFILFKLKNGWEKGARNVLEQALKVMPKRKHIGVLAKFAQLEFAHGSAERGRTMFDSLLSSQPKRLDLWHIWLQCEIKEGDIEAARRLFEKVCAMSWSSKKMKFLLKMYLSFEKTDGTPEGVQRVKEIATEYVDSKT